MLELLDGFDLDECRGRAGYAGERSVHLQVAL
jgi:hypothetical protein